MYSSRDLFFSPLPYLSSVNHYWLQVLERELLLQLAVIHVRLERRDYDDTKAVLLRALPTDFVIVPAVDARR